MPLEAVCHVVAELCGVNTRSVRLKVLGANMNSVRQCPRPPVVVDTVFLRVPHSPCVNSAAT